MVILTGVKKTIGLLASNETDRFMTYRLIPPRHGRTGPNAEDSILVPIAVVERL